MEPQEFKQNVYQSISELVKSLANPHRLEILEILSNGEKTVEEVSDETGMSFANTSQHLQNLKRAKWVKSRREKNYVFYDLKNAYVYAIWKTLREVSRIQSAEINETIERFRKDKGVRMIKETDLLSYEPYVLIDARPLREYEKGHLEGALSIHSGVPLPKDKQVIVYSRGPICVLADDTVKDLTSKGYDPVRLEEGYRDLRK
jgi:DNA-binding transcriptional ArsR family regulator